MSSWNLVLREAMAFAQQQRHEECFERCRAILDANWCDLAAILDVGALLHEVGFISSAARCYRRAQELFPDDLRAEVNLANIARESGDHAKARQMYAQLVARLPDNRVIRRNAVVSLEYDPDATDAQRFKVARAWGEWASARVGPCPQPPRACVDKRPLRVGYVSADFCNHTVGLMVKDVLAAHDGDAVIPYTYSAGHVHDDVTLSIQNTTKFRDVSSLDDIALAQAVRKDGIDILIDLSGHTAGSRLTSFALRPAPLQLSWLSYATTGLEAVDAVVTDEWHCPAGVEKMFTEAVIRLPDTRFCFSPLAWAPAVAAVPSIRSKRITFGSFNNTSKLNAKVIAVWAEILLAVPESRLVLKWRTFNDPEFSTAVRSAFVRHGIAPDRIELRGSSFHLNALQEYADIDIALDPFPFSGAMTSFDALWMGVPVVSLPETRTVSRQTLCLLANIGLERLAVTSTAAYAKTAVELALDPSSLVDLRQRLRPMLSASVLVDVGRFTRNLEAAYQRLVQHTAGLIA